MGKQLLYNKCDYKCYIYTFTRKGVVKSALDAMKSTCSCLNIRPISDVTHSHADIGANWHGCRAIVYCVHTANGTMRNTWNGTMYG